MPDVMRDFEVKRDDLRTFRVRESTLPSAADLAPGQVLCRVDHFAFTANNITYAAFGDAMKYWNFYPAPEGWGRIPVWGYADVVASAHGEIAVGERVYGYWPMGSHAVLQADRVKPQSFVDASPHRDGLAAVYNQYVRTGANPNHQRAAEPYEAILRPLFMTSFLIDDFLADNDFFGATQVLLSSASSKTSLGTAFCLDEAERSALGVIGLTSPRNADFVASTGYFDRVVPYADITRLDPTVPTVFVDMAGDAAVRAAIHGHFGDALKYSCSVGGTHWEELGGFGSEPLPGPRPAMFFAPNQIKKRSVDWGPGGLDARVGEAWGAFMASVETWMTVVETHGIEAFGPVYTAVLEGKVGPDEGHMLAP